MGIKAGNLPITTIADTSHILVAEGLLARRALYGDIKKDLLGTAILGTTDKTIKGAINEVKALADSNTTSLYDYAKVNNYLVDIGTANTYVITPTTAITAYSAGQRFTFKAVNANSGASTLNVNGLGAKALVKDVNVALVTGDILAGQIVTAIYDGTNFQIVPDLKAQLALKANLASPDFSGTPTISSKTVATTETATATLLNGWVNQVGDTRVSRSGNQVTINLCISSGTTTNNIIIANIPVGFRPTVQRYCPMSSCGADYVYSFGNALIGTDGNIGLDATVLKNTRLVLSATYTI